MREEREKERERERVRGERERDREIATRSTREGGRARRKSE